MAKLREIRYTTKQKFIDTYHTCHFFGMFTIQFIFDLSIFINTGQSLDSFN